MEETEIMEQSLLKNLQEFVEYVVYDLHITNYYDLVDYIEDLRTNELEEKLKYYRDKELVCPLSKEEEYEYAKLRDWKRGVE
jgi:hypothetical protein